MDDEQFTKLFTYMQRELTSVRSDIARLEERMDGRFDHVYSVLDSILKAQETHEQERLITNHQLQRHEDWIGQLADHTHTRLVPGQQ